MGASRLLSILLELTVRGRVSARELAAQLEVSQRTVYRDVDALSSAGIPIYATRGRAGGFQLLDGYRTKLTGLTGDEADALFLAGLPRAAADLGLGSVLAATELKLLSAMPPQLRERAVRVRDRFHLDAPGWLRETDPPRQLAVIADAVWAQRRVEVRYERANGAIVERILEPVGLVLKAGTWYLVALVADEHPKADMERGTPRTYRLSRVLAAAVLEETFERPSDFDLRSHWEHYQRGYAQRVYRESATIRLSEQGRQLLFLVGPIPARAAHRAMGVPGATGWAQTTLPIESVRHAHHALLQLGADVEVVEPAELRDLIAGSADALRGLYGRSECQAGGWASGGAPAT
ncbi:MAG: YafY family transcriptional regulator [Actinomycetota bacterium]|nr:YafY family transcriptional regulator [Actinomycetota bacterium]